MPDGIIQINDELMHFSVLRSDERFFHIEIMALKPGVCRNNWDFTMEGIEKCMHTFRGQPILCAYKGNRIGDGHNQGVQYDPATRKTRADFRGADAERIVGYIPEDANIRIEERDGEKWLVISAVLFRYYNQQLVEDVIKKGLKRISVETLPTKVEEAENNVDIYHEWIGYGITILGDDVTPAVDGANVKALAASEEFKQIKLVAASLIANPDNPELIKTLNKNISKGVRKTMLNLNKDLKLKLADKFKPFGKVLSYSQDNAFVSVLRANNTISMYPLGEDTAETGVAEKNFTDMAVKVCGKTQDDEGNLVDVFMDGEMLLAEASEQCDELTAERDAKIAELTERDAKIAELETELSGLKESISKRKCDDVVSVLNALRAETEASCEEGEKIEQSQFSELIEAAKKGEFNSFVNAEGEWDGVKVAQEKLDAMYGAKAREFKQKNSTKKVFAFDLHGDGSAQHESSIFAKYSDYALEK